MSHLTIGLKKYVSKLIKSTKGNGITEAIIVIAAALIIGGLIMIPGLKTLGTTMVTQISAWWTSLSGTIFSAT